MRGEPLLENIREWAYSAAAKYASEPWHGTHDEGTFASSWVALYRITGDERLREFVLRLRDDYAAWSKEHQYHGYHPKQEAHHGPELHLYFLSRVWSIDKENPLNAQLLDDVAHHVGNWADGVPDWFDYESGLFRSIVLGTRHVDPKPPNDVNVPDHMRFANLAGIAYLATGKDRYLEWALQYALKWAEATINSPDRPPIALHAKCEEAELEAAYAQARSSFFGAAPNETCSPIMRIEPHVSAGTVDAFLDIWKLTGEQRLLHAARVMLKALLPTLANPYSHAPAYLWSKYRAWTNDRTYDSAILDIIRAQLPDEPVERIDADLDYAWPEAQRPKIGHRKDQPRWRHFAGGREIPLCPSPGALTLASEVGGEEALLDLALRVANLRLDFARRHFPHGRKHGCGAQSVSAIVRGHGRNNNYGNVTSSVFVANGVYDFFDIPFLDGDPFELRLGQGRSTSPAEVTP